MDPFSSDHNIEISNGVYVLMHYAYHLKVFCLWLLLLYCKWIEYNLDYVFGC